MSFDPVTSESTPLPQSPESPAGTSTNTSESPRVDLLNFTWSELENLLQSWGQPKYRVKQLFRWIYEELETDFNNMTDLPKALRQRLNEEAAVGTLEVESVADSVDGTKKILYRLQDGLRIESVLIPEEKRNTLCVSSQVGCALGCRFCYTASLGPGRNLTVGEYMAQYLDTARMLAEDSSITNVVFMGMGEPLVNFSNLMQTLELLTDARGLNLGRRRLTVSTAGLCPQILQMGEKFPVRLAISLHATTDEQRDDLMPINQRYPLETLFDTLQQYRKLTPTHRMPITLEFTLIEGVNNSMADARRLAKLAHSIQAKVNLIPYNEHPGAPYKRPSQRNIFEFRDELQRKKIRATCRITRGDDIYAACGQLAIHGPEDAETDSPSPSPERVVPHHRKRRN